LRTRGPNSDQPRARTQTRGPNNCVRPRSRLPWSTSPRSSMPARRSCAFRAVVGSCAPRAAGFRYRPEPHQADRDTEGLGFARDRNPRGSASSTSRAKLGANAQIRRHKLTGRVWYRITVDAASLPSRTVSPKRVVRLPYVLVRSGSARWGAVGRCWTARLRASYHPTRASECSFGQSDQRLDLSAGGSCEPDGCGR